MNSATRLWILVSILILWNLKSGNRPLSKLHWSFWNRTNDFDLNLTSRSDSTTLEVSVNVETLINKLDKDKAMRLILDSVSYWIYFLRQPKKYDGKIPRCYENSQKYCLDYFVTKTTNPDWVEIKKKGKTRTDCFRQTGYCGACIQAKTSFLNAPRFV